MRQEYPFSANKHQNQQAIGHEAAVWHESLGSTHNPPELFFRKAAYQARKNTP